MKKKKIRQMRYRNTQRKLQDENAWGRMKKMADFNGKTEDWENKKIYNQWLLKLYTWQETSSGKMAKAESLTETQKFRTETAWRLSYFKKGKGKKRK